MELLRILAGALVLCAMVAVLILVSVGTAEDRRGVAADTRRRQDAQVSLAGLRTQAVYQATLLREAERQAEQDMLRAAYEHLRREQR